MFSRKSSIIVSAPPERFPQLPSLDPSLPFLEVCNAIVAELGSDVSRVVGPAFHGYASEPIEENSRANVRDIVRDVAETLADSGDPTGWEDSGMEAEKNHYMGYYRGENLVAIANYSIIADGVAFVGYYTHPEFRGRGFGTSVLCGAISHAVKQGLIVTYQTLFSNVGAIKSARRAGVHDYGRHMAIVCS